MYMTTINGSNASLEKKAIICHFIELARYRIISSQMLNILAIKWLGWEDDGHFFFWNTCYLIIRILSMIIVMLTWKLLHLHAGITLQHDVWISLWQIYKEKLPAVPEGSHFWYPNVPLIVALHPKQETLPCGLQVLYECAQDGHAATLEPKHSQTRLMCDKAPSCDSEKLNALESARAVTVAVWLQQRWYEANSYVFEHGPLWVSMPVVNVSIYNEWLLSTVLSSTGDWLMDGVAHFCYLWLSKKRFPDAPVSVI